MPKKIIYLDNAATTPVDKKVLQKMLPYFSEKFGNAMSLHTMGEEAGDAVEEARENIAKILNCDVQEIFFTSGATESNNTAIKGVVKRYIQEFKGEIPHIITSAFEHHSVLDVFKSLERDKKAEVSFVAPKADGVIDVDDLKKEIKNNTILISIMYVNNEIGTIQPIKEIGDLVKEVNKKQRKSPLIFHTDAVQALNYFTCDVEYLGVDLMSLSAHKIYGPKGIGVLYKRKNLNIPPLMNGGGQERNFRPGTHSVPQIVGFGEAIKLVKKRLEKGEDKKMKEKRDYLIEKILKEIPDVYLNGSREKRSPNNIHFRFDSVEGESLLMKLDMEGIEVGTGSACSSASLQASHVLLALGLKQEQTHGSLRITLGKDTCKKDLDYFFSKLKKIVTDLRKISGNVLDEFKNK